MVFPRDGLLSRGAPKRIPCNLSPLAFVVVNGACGFSRSRVSLQPETAFQPSGAGSISSFVTHPSQLISMPGFGEMLPECRAPPYLSTHSWSNLEFVSA